jgi:hypothetical protein
MVSLVVLKRLIEIDEWVSKRENYSYSLLVNKYGCSFWVFNQKTEKGQSVESVEQIDESKLECEDVCEKLEEVK